MSGAVSAAGASTAAEPNLSSSVQIKRSLEALVGSAPPAYKMLMLTDPDGDTLYAEVC